MSTNLTFGSEYHFYCEDTKHYLDVCNYAADRTNYFLRVSSSPQKDRSPATGTWKIVSASGKADGAPVKEDDEIYLVNSWGGDNFLCAKEDGTVLTTKDDKDPTRKWTFKISGGSAEVGQPILLMNETLGGFLCPTDTQMETAGCAGNKSVVVVRGAIQQLFEWIPIAK